ncbi:hypothetical protein ABK040_000969 [Willaertia magna]
MIIDELKLLSSFSFHSVNSLLSIDSITSLLTNVNNNSFVNETTEDTLCHPFLTTNTSSWYFVNRDSSPNETVQYYMCKDTIGVPISVGFFYGTIIFFTISSIILLLMKRSSKYIKARSPIYLWCTIISTFIFHSAYAFRLIVGRRSYPCAIYSLSLFITSPFIFLPSFFRFFRAWLLYEINHIKTRVLGEKRRVNAMQELDYMMELNNVPMTPRNGNDSVESNNNDSQQQVGFSEVPTIVIAEHKHSVMTNDSENNTETNNEVNNDSEKENKNSIGEENNNNNNSKLNENEATTSSFSATTPRANAVNHLLSPSNTDFTFETFSDTASVVDFNIHFQKDIKKLKIFEFFASHKFIITIFLISAGFHFCLWAIFGGIEELVFKSKNDPNAFRIFIYDGGMFEFRRGCGMTTNFVIIIGIQGLFYLSLEVIAAVLLAIRADGDTWFIRKEAFIAAIVEIIFVLAFVISGQLHIINKLVDYILPNGLAFLIGTNFEILITTFIPLCYSVYYDRREKLIREAASKTKLERLLYNKKTFIIFLEFARKSFCPESVLCWEDVQKYRRLKKSKRRIYARYILEKYLKTGESPLELNISTNVARYQEMDSKIKDLNKEMERGAFDYLELHCLRDMTDIYSRLLNDNEEISNLVKKWQEEKKTVEEEEDILTADV